LKMTCAEACAELAPEVHVIAYVTSAGELSLTLAVPLVGLLPDHPLPPPVLLAVQVAELVAFHVSVVDSPTKTFVGDAESDAAGSSIVTLVCAVASSWPLEQCTPYVYVPAAVSVIDLVPLVGRLPVHPSPTVPPVAEQFAFADAAHVSVTGIPTVTDCASAARLTCTLPWPVSGMPRLTPPIVTVRPVLDTAPATVGANLTAI
jgi:hypothetical protein